jgi:radical SAM protein with 4Fe4S-binding SPASM domain
MITAYLKPTNFCNVDCAHCYLPLSVRANKERMSEETLHKVMIFLKEMKEKNKHDAIFLIWHGGEPLILPLDYFNMTSKIIDQYFKNDEIIEAVQTSLSPYRREHSQVVKERWRSEIGSSIDFNSRLIKGSVEEYQKLWMSKVDMAREDEILVIPGMVPSKKDCYQTEHIYKWFEDRQFWLWNIDRYSNVGGTLPDFSTNAEHSKFLRELFDLTIISIEKNGIAPYIKPIAAAIGGILYDQPGDRWGGTCQSDFVVINPDGKLNNCPDKDSFEKSYGNLFDGYNSFAKSTDRKKWIRIQQAGHRIDECYNCENASWCKSGCPITGNACSINGITDECSGFKGFITHIRNFLKKDMGNELLLKKYLHQEFLPKNLNFKTNGLMNIISSN